MTNTGNTGRKVIGHRSHLATKTSKTYIGRNAAASSSSQLSLFSVASQGCKLPRKCKRQFRQAISIVILAGITGILTFGGLFFCLEAGKERGNRDAEGVGRYWNGRGGRGRGVEGGMGCEGGGGRDIVAQRV